MSRLTFLGFREVSLKEKRLVIEGEAERAEGFEVLGEACIGRRVQGERILGSEVLF